MKDYRATSATPQTADGDWETGPYSVVAGVPTLRWEISTGDFPSLLTGIQRLVQRVIMLLLSDRGTDIFDPSAGSSFVSIARTMAQTGRKDILIRELSKALSTVETQIAKEQAGNSGLSLDERLVSLRLDPVTVEGRTYPAIELDHQTGRVLIRVTVLTEAGNIDYISVLETIGGATT